MKKIFFIIGFMFLLISGSYASDYDYEVNISVESDTYDIDLQNLNFALSSGESKISGGLKNPGWSTGRYTEDIDFTYSQNNIVIKTNHYEDLHLILSDDLESYGYYIIKNISKEELTKGGVLNIIVSLEALDEVNLTHNLQGDVSVCLFGNKLVDEPDRDDVRFSWQKFYGFSKKMYLSTGEFDVVIAHENDDVIKLYSQDKLDSSNSEYTISQSSKKLIEHNLSIPKSYEEYSYFGLQSRMSSGEYLRFWTHRESLDFTLLIDPVFKENFLKFYISNKSYTIYDKCLNIEADTAMSLTDTYYYHEIRTKKNYSNQIYVDTFFRDFNGNLLEAIGTSHGKDMLMHVYLDNVLISRHELSSYWDYGVFDLDETKDYIARVMSKTDPRVNGYSEFELSYNNGVPEFKFIKVVMDDYLATHPITTKYSNNQYIVSCELYNETDNARSYDIYSKGAEGVLLKKVTLEARERVTEHFIFPVDMLVVGDVTGLEVSSQGAKYNYMKFSEVVSNDISVHWAEDIISKLLMKNIIFNKSKNSYFPDEAITRGEFATYLTLALDISLAENSKTFTDVSKEHDLYNFIMIASSNGLINGYNGGEFKPDVSIKRQDASIIIKNALMAKGLILNENNLYYRFKDGSTIDEYARSGVNYCVTNKLLSGKTGGMFDAHADLSRAEAAVIITNIINKINE